jgi:uncharacterized membrane protein
MLEEVEHHPYLGVELGNDLNWNHHIDQTTTKAIGIWHSLEGTSINAGKKSRRKRTQHSYAQTLNTDYLYGSLSANIKLMQLKWSNVELPAL